jgi:transcriptional regulator with XRE-family HTH domain
MARELRRLGALVIRRRYLAEKSQEDLAVEANIALRTLGMVEAGIGNPSFRTLFSIAKALKVSVAELFDELNRPPDGSA